MTKPSFHVTLLKLGAGIALLVGLLVITSAVTYDLLVKNRGNAFDFYPRYVGAQALLNGENPYSAAITERIQIGMFGGVLPESFDQQRFAYPAYTAVLLIPFVLLTSETAIPLWMSLQLLAILVSVLIWIAILEWKPPIWLLPLLIVLLVFVFRYPVNVYVLGQFTGVMFLLISLAALALKHQRDSAAGVLLALALNPPTIALGVAGVVCALYLLQKRWILSVSFGLVIGIAIAVTVLLIGWWVPQFLADMTAYSDYAYPVWVVRLLPVYASILLIGFTGWVGLTFWRKPPLALRLHTDGFAFAILVALLLLPQTGNYYLTLLIVPLLLVIQRAAQRRQWLLLIGCLLLVALPWMIWSTVEHYREVEGILLPLFMLFLWWGQLRLTSAPRVATRAD